MIECSCTTNWMEREIIFCPLHKQAEEMLRLLEESDSVGNDCRCKRCLDVKTVVKKARGEMSETNWDSQEADACVCGHHKSAHRWVEWTTSCDVAGCECRDFRKKARGE